MNTILKFTVTLSFVLTMAFRAEAQPGMPDLQQGFAKVPSNNAMQHKGPCVYMFYYDIEAKYTTGPRTGRVSRITISDIVVANKGREVGYSSSSGGPWLFKNESFDIVNSKRDDIIRQYDREGTKVRYISLPWKCRK